MGKKAKLTAEVEYDYTGPMGTRDRVAMVRVKFGDETLAVLPAAREVGKDWCSIADDEVSVCSETVAPYLRKLFTSDV
jgi:hypothetical protein